MTREPAPFVVGQPTLLAGAAELARIAQLWLEFTGRAEQ